MKTSTESVRRHRAAKKALAAAVYGTPICPRCEQELQRLGKALKGVWLPGPVYRCTDCPTGKNRFTVGAFGIAVPEVRVN